jgi:hypothetical protein
MTDYGQRVPGCSGSLDKVCYNAWPFEKPFSGARRTVIVDWDTFHAVPGSRTTAGTPTPDAVMAVAMQPENDRAALGR